MPCHDSWSPPVAIDDAVLNVSGYRPHELKGQGFDVGVRVAGLKALKGGYHVPCEVDNEVGHLVGSNLVIQSIEQWIII